MTALAWFVVADAAIVAAVAVGVGAWAPRWPDRWLSSDRWLGAMGWEAACYRRLRVGRWGNRLPEAGATFGGPSKRRLPGTSPEHLRSYVIELRRAEWVHLASAASALLLIGPWWLRGGFAVVTLAVNVTFLAILRNNRLRVRRILEGGRTWDV